MQTERKSPDGSERSVRCHGRTLMQEVVASNTTGIVESVTQFQKDAVIDEYTQQLIEEGLI